MTAKQYIRAFVSGKETDFSRKELGEHLRACGVSSSASEKALQRMLESGEIEKGSMRGSYKGSKSRMPEFNLEPSEELITLYEQLKAEFPLVSIVALDVRSIIPLMHHVPNIRMTVLYVEKNGFADVADTLETLTDKLVFRNPTRSDLTHLAFGRDYIVVRPLISQAPKRKQKGISVPKIEKTLVDIICDEEFYYLQGNETYNIYETALSDYSINLKSLLRYAGRRSITEKVNRILNTVKDDTSSK